MKPIYETKGKIGLDSKMIPSSGMDQLIRVITERACDAKQKPIII